MDLRFHKEVSIPVGKIILKGEVVIPSKATAIIIFSHGSGSSRFSKSQPDGGEIPSAEKFWYAVV